MDKPYANGKTYEEVYNEFWKELVENPDGTLKKDQIMRELADYNIMMSEMTKLYSDITGGRVSNPMTMASDVLAEHDDETQRLYDEGWQDGYEDGLKA